MSKEVKEITDQLSKHNIKLVDYDENENSIKNFLFSMIGEEPRGHIGPSSWLDPSGELTIYVPKSKNTPEKLRLFLIEEIKHVDQIRETPFSTGASALFEMAKEGISRIPTKLLNKLPDFVSEEESEEYDQKQLDAAMSGGDLDEIESPYWKERSGIGKLFRELRYNRYADPDSVEGIHRNRERYAPVLEKYGMDEIETDEATLRKYIGAAKAATSMGKQAGGLVMNYGDYGRSYT